MDISRLGPVEEKPVCFPPAAEPDPRVEALVHDIIGKVADRWTMLVLEVRAEKGTLRFSQIGKAVGRISQKMLTQTLRRLEEDRLVHRTVHPVIRPMSTMRSRRSE